MNGSCSKLQKMSKNFTGHEKNPIGPNNSKKEAYISILENKLDNRDEGAGEDIDEGEIEMEEVLPLEIREKEGEKKTGGGSPILPTGADAVLGEVLADQLQPLENNFDDGAQYFGIVDNSKPQNPSSSIPIRKRKVPIPKKSVSSIKKKIYERKLFLTNLEIKHKQRLFQKELKLRNVQIRKAELQLEKLNDN